MGRLPGSSGSGAGGGALGSGGGGGLFGSGEFPAGGGVGLTGAVTTGGGVELGSPELTSGGTTAVLAGAAAAAVITGGPMGKSEAADPSAMLAGDAKITAAMIEVF